MADPAVPPVVRLCELARHGREQSEVPLPVVVVREDRLTAVPPAGHVVDPGSLQTKRTGHAPTLRRESSRDFRAWVEKEPRKRIPRLSHRGAQIRTGDLSDPNGARYQAAPHPVQRR